MIRLIYFMVCWCTGLFALNKLVFSMMKEIIQDPIAISIIYVLLVTVFTVVLGCLVDSKKRG